MRISELTVSEQRKDKLKLNSRKFYRHKNPANLLGRILNFV